MRPDDFLKVDRTIGYPVRDIMTRDPLCWDGQAATKDAILQEAAGLSFIPVRSNGTINGIISLDALRGDGLPTPLTSDWLITSDTPILKVLALFAANTERVFLVLETSEVVGIVHPSDFNKIPARASLYLLVAHFEAELAGLIRSVIGTEDADYEPYLAPERFEWLQKRRTEDKLRDVELDITHYLDISDFRNIVKKEARLYERLGFIEPDNHARNKLQKVIHRKLSVEDVRNPVSHASRLLISSRNEILRVNEICDDLIYFHQQIRRS